MCPPLFPSDNFLSVSSTPTHSVPQTRNLGVLCEFSSSLTLHAQANRPTSSSPQIHPEYLFTSSHPWSMPSPPLTLHNSFLIGLPLHHCSHTGLFSAPARPKLLPHQSLCTAWAPPCLNCSSPQGWRPGVLHLNSQVLRKAFSDNLIYCKNLIIFNLCTLVNIDVIYLFDVCFIHQTI